MTQTPPPNDRYSNASPYPSSRFRSESKDSAKDDSCCFATSRRVCNSFLCSTFMAHMASFSPASSVSRLLLAASSSPNCLALIRCQPCRTTRALLCTHVAAKSSRTLLRSESVAALSHNENDNSTTRMHDSTTLDTRRTAVHACAPAPLSASPRWTSAPLAPAPIQKIAVSNIRNGQQHFPCHSYTLNPRAMLRALLLQG